MSERPRGSHRDLAARVGECCHRRGWHFTLRPGDGPEIVARVRLGEGVTVRAVGPTTNTAIQRLAAALQELGAFDG